MDFYYLIQNCPPFVCPDIISSIFIRFNGNIPNDSMGLVFRFIKKNIKWIVIVNFNG